VALGGASLPDEDGGGSGWRLSPDFKPRGAVQEHFLRKVLGEWVLPTWQTVRDENANVGAT